MTDDLKQWDPADFARQIIQPGIEAIQHYDPASLVLDLGTGIQESKLKYVRQIGGAALGYFQMEPFTFNDLFSRWLGPSSRQYIMDGLRMLTPHPEDPESLVTCPQFAAAMCRVKYLSIPAIAPQADDVAGMAAYYLKYYNAGGKATTAQAVNSFKQAIAALQGNG